MAEEYYIFRRKGRENLYVQFRDPRTRKLGAAKSSGKTSEAAALRWAKAEYRRIVEESAKLPSPDITLRTWAEPFFGESCPYVARRKIEGKKFSAHYIRDNRDYLERFVLTDSSLVDLPLKEVRRRDILAWRQRLVAAHGARRSSARIVQVLKKVLNEAVYQELLDYSPAAKVSLPAYEKKERDAVDLDSLKKMLDPVNYADPRHWAATVTAAFTGMRAAEVQALEWDNLDFERRVIYVRQAFKDQSWTLGPPKSGKPRVAPMPETLAALLLKWRKVNETPRWVFGTGKVWALGYKNWNAAVKKAAKAAGCPGARLHYLRHSLNTYLIGAGVDPAIVRASLGWSDEKVQAGYTHADKFDYRAQAEAIDRFLMIGDAHVQAASDS
jgi:integrase